MSRRLPDEYFRQTISESSDVRPGEERHVESPPRGRIPVTSGLPLVLVVACAVAAFLLGYAGVRALMLGEEPEEIHPNPSGAATAPTRPAVPWTGPVKPVKPLLAEGTCEAGEPPDVLLDGRSATVWRCPGNGAEQSLTFQFGDAVDLVGVRLAGNVAANPDVAARERRITEVRWTFDDGSWVAHPLASDSASPQELRFPAVATSAVTLTVVSVTEPGADLDQVSIAAVDFLTTG